jgi:PIN domain nuclease of toxin-antitoxin system
MNLLLHTHVLIWWLEGSKRLGIGAKKAMLSPDATLWISCLYITVTRSTECSSRKPNRKN